MGWSAYTPSTFRPIQAHAWPVKPCAPAHDTAPTCACMGIGHFHRQGYSAARPAQNSHAWVRVGAQATRVPFKCVPLSPPNMACTNVRRCKLHQGAIECMRLLASAMLRDVPSQILERNHPSVAFCILYSILCVCRSASETVADEGYPSELAAAGRCTRIRSTAPSFEHTCGLQLLSSQLAHSTQPRARVH